MPELRIAVDGDEGGRQARSLRDWLLATDEVRTAARIDLESPDAGPDEMGAVLDIVKLALDTGFSAGGLAVAIAAWRQSRTDRPTIILIRDERTESIADQSAEQIRGSIDRMLDAD